MAFRKEKKVDPKGAKLSSKKESVDTKPVDEIVERGYNNAINGLDRKMRAHKKAVDEGLIPNNPTRLTVELFLINESARKKLAERLKEKKISLTMGEFSCYASVLFRCKDVK